MAEAKATPLGAGTRAMVEGAKIHSLIALAEYVGYLVAEVHELVAVVEAQQPVSITEERTVDLTPPADERPRHSRDEIVAEVEDLLPISAERLAQGMGITVHSLYRALRRAGRDDLWRRLDREYLR